MIKRPDIETIRAESTSGIYTTELYRGVRQQNGLLSDSEEVLVLAPGWLGSGTLHFAATHLAQKGHDVAVVNHDSTSIWHPNKDRSRHVHLTARAATQVTGKSGVILIGHSLGNRDIHSAATAAIDRQVKNPDDSSLYRINAIGAVAGVGLSGKLIHADKLHKEIKYVSVELADHPIEELSIVGRSLLNLSRHPILRGVEGLAAAKCDVRDNARDFILNMLPRSYIESYMEEDGIIPPPDDRAGYYMHSGTHLRPVTDGDTMCEIIDLLLESNNPAGLDIAHHKGAA